MGSQGNAQNEPPHLLLTEELAKILIAGVQKTLLTMFEIHATPGQHKYETDPTIVSDISGVVGMVQDKSEALLITSFEKEAAFFILGKIYATEFKELDKTVRDGVGEITNIVHGILKKHLNDSGHSFRLAIPAVIIGEYHSISKVSVAKSLVVPFSTKKGKFYVEIAIHAEKTN